MKKTIVSLAVVFAMCISPAFSLAGPGDIYVSFSAFGDGNAAGNTTATFENGSSGSAYIYVDENFSIDTGAFLDVLNDNAGVLAFTGAEVFNPDINVAGSFFQNRWQSVGDQGVGATLVDELNGFSVNEGSGILPSQVTGSLFEDQGHDASSSAFLFARVDFDVVGVGSANISLATGEGLVVNDNVELSPSYGSAKVEAIPEPASATLLAAGLIGLVVRRRR